MIRTSFALVSISLAACSSAMPPAGASDVPDAAEPPATKGPGAFAPDYATSPAFFTQMKGLRKGLASSPHNLVQIWYSDNLKPLVSQPRFTAPQGTVAIKLQDRDGDGVPENIMVMIKQAPGFDPPGGDWSYEQRAADGTLQQSGKNSFCSGCHTAFTATDGLPGVVLVDP